MQYDRNVLNSERRVEMRLTDLVQVRFSYQGNNYPACIFLVQRRLNHDNEGNTVAASTAVAMNVELRHSERRVLVGKRAMLFAETVPGGDRFLYRLCLGEPPPPLLQQKIRQQ